MILGEVAQSHPVGNAHGLATSEPLLQPQSLSLKGRLRNTTRAKGRSTQAMKMTGDQDTSVQNQHMKSLNPRNSAPRHHKAIHPLEAAAASTVKAQNHSTITITEKGHIQATQNLVDMRLEIPPNTPDI